jgi:hypothetical protein
VDLPLGLDKRRHVERVSHSAWPRRVLIVILAAACVLALLNVFGQRATLSRTDGSAASLSVQSPDRLRGGLVYTSQITVTAHQRIGDLRVFLSSGWFRGMTFNGAVPQANNQSSTAQGVVFDYGSLDAGEQFPIWISWQTNPVTVGSRSQDVVVYDGANTLVTMHRPVFVFP